MPRKKSVALATVPATDRSVELARAAEGANKALEALRSYIVADDAGAAWVADKLKAVKVRIKDLEAERTEVSKPLNEALRAHNAQFRAILSPLEQAEDILKSKLCAYRDAKQAERVAALPAAAAGDTAAIAAMAPPALPAGISYVDYWEPEITDPVIVPRAFCLPDLGLLRKALEAVQSERGSEAVPEIAGVRYVKRSRAIARS